MTQRQNILLMITGIAMGVLLLVLVFGNNGLLELKHQRAAHAELLQANDALTQANVRLSRTIDRLQHDPEFVEALARRELGMIRSDELIFQFQSNTPRSKP
ncbi:MAG: septum formation initiator family protein [Desulfatitalea sp.]|nr:septum formation initiator family protein [Desulfatitalea sp.]MBI5895504.1 septum formation initiator family protein [Desulfobacterales bacterium]